MLEFFTGGGEGWGARCFKYNVGITFGLLTNLSYIDSKQILLAELNMQVKTLDGKV